MFPQPVSTRGIPRGGNVAGGGGGGPGMAMSPNDDNAVLYYHMECPYTRKLLTSFQMPATWILVDLKERIYDPKTKATFVMIPGSNQLMEMPVFVNGSPILHLPNDRATPILSDAEQIVAAFPQYFNDSTFQQVAAAASNNPQASNLTSTGNHGLYRPPTATHPGGSSYEPPRRFAAGRATEEDNKRAQDAYQQQEAELLEQQRRSVQSHTMLPPGPRLLPMGSATSLGGAAPARLR